jgi:hypothetical protein
MLGLIWFNATKKTELPSEIRAHRFILVDDHDKPIASWTDEKGYGALAFDKDQFGNKTIYIGETTNGAEISLFSNGRGRAGLSVTESSALLNLQGGNTSIGTGHISLLGGEQSTLIIDNAQQAQMQISPAGSGISFYSDGPKNKRQWDFTGDRFNLYGLKINLFDSAGNILQTLPTTNHVIVNPSQ